MEINARNSMIDKNSGAILFRKTPETDEQRRIRELEKRVEALERRCERCPLKGSEENASRSG